MSIDAAICLCAMFSQGTHGAHALFDSLAEMLTGGGRKQYRARAGPLLRYEAVPIASTTLALAAIAAVVGERHPQAMFVFGSEHFAEATTTQPALVAMPVVDGVGTDVRQHRDPDARALVCLLVHVCHLVVRSKMVHATLVVDILPAQNLAYGMNTQRGLFPNSRRRLFHYALCVPDVIRDLILRCRRDYARVWEFGYVARLPDKAMPRCVEEQHQTFLAGHRGAPTHSVKSISRRRIAVCTMPHTARSLTCPTASLRYSGSEEPSGALFASDA